jgi:integrase
MKRAVLKARPYPKNNPTLWVIDYRANGKRKREFYKSRAAAEKALYPIRKMIDEGGRNAMDLSTSLRVMAHDANKVLEGTGKTILDAARFYKAHLDASDRSITVSALIEKYMVTQTGNSDIHQRDLRNRYNRFADSFGPRMVHMVPSQEIKDWINGLGLGPQSFNNWRDRLGFLFGYAVEEKHLEANPIDKKFKRKEITEEAPEIFSVEDLSKLLDAASGELLPVLVLGAFCGIRVAELMRLEWCDVNFQTGYVHVKGRKAKSRSNRSIEMPQNLVAWLTPYKGRTGKIWTGTHMTFHHSVAALCRATGVTRRQNGLRHSYASYFLKRYENENLLKLNLGHAGSDLIFSNYRALTTKEDAERYWQIRPALEPANIVSMTA